MIEQFLSSAWSRIERNYMPFKIKHRIIILSDKRKGTQKFVPQYKKLFFWRCYRKYDGTKVSYDIFSIEPIAKDVAYGPVPPSTFGERYINDAYKQCIGYLNAQMAIEEEKQKIFATPSKSIVWTESKEEPDPTPPKGYTKHLV